MIMCYLWNRTPQDINTPEFGSTAIDSALCQVKDTQTLYSQIPPSNKWDLAQLFTKSCLTSVEELKKFKEEFEKEIENFDTYAKPEKLSLFTEYSRGGEGGQKWGGD